MRDTRRTWTRGTNAMSTAASQRKTRRRGRCGGASGAARGGGGIVLASSTVLRSERDADTHVHAIASLVLAVGDVEAQRTDGAAVVHAGAEAEDRVELVPAVGGVAAIDEESAEQGWQAIGQRMAASFGR